MADIIGNQLPQPDPRGWLTFDELPDALRSAEDSTQAWDHQTSYEGRYRLSWTRPATPTERLLLTHLGYDDLPDDLDTRVSYKTPGVRNRRWPALENPSQEEN